MNLADLTTLIILLGSVISSVGASHSSCAPWWLSALMGVAGLLFGLLAAILYRKAAYRLLRNDGSLSFILYCLLPIIVIPLAGIFCVSLTLWLTHHLGYSSAAVS